MEWVNKPVGGWEEDNERLVIPETRWQGCLLSYELQRGLQHLVDMGNGLLTSSPKPLLIPVCQQPGSLNAGRPLGLQNGSYTSAGETTPGHELSLSPHHPGLLPRVSPQITLGRLGGSLSPHAGKGVPVAVVSRAGSLMTPTEELWPAWLNWLISKLLFLSPLLARTA